MNSELIVLFGPPCVGKTTFALSTLSIFSRVDLEDVVNCHPDYSMRQILNMYIVKPLKDGKRVVVDNTNEKASLRKSIYNLITRKISSTAILCKIFAPQFGEDQLLWNREMLIAQSLLSKVQSHKDWRKVEDLIKNWNSHSDEPSTEEGKCDLSRMETKLQVQTMYKFDVPALFIQWEALYEIKDGDINVKNGVVDALIFWSKCNPCGRILIICDGCRNSKFTSEDLQREKSQQIQATLLKITSKFKDCPLYLLDMDRGGSYCVAPKPGLIAFLFTLHTINLQHKMSVYWYNTTAHMQMAEQVGLKHIKASKVFAVPKLASNTSAAFRPAIPKMLSVISYLSPLQTWRDRNSCDKTIPLYTEAKEAQKSERMICKDMKNSGRKLYLAYHDLESLDRYQKLYEDNAALLNEESKIEKLTDILSEKRSAVATKSSLNKSLSTDRDLPEWMKPRKKRKSAPEFADSSLEDRSKQKLPEKPKLPSLSSNTLYALNDEELVDTSKWFFSETGEKIPTEDEVQLYLSQNDSMLSQTCKKRQLLVENTDKSDTDTECEAGIPEKRSKFIPDSEGFDFLDELFSSPNTSAQAKEDVVKSSKKNVKVEKKEFIDSFMYHSPQVSQKNDGSPSSLKCIPNSYATNSESSNASVGNNYYGSSSSGSASKKAHSILPDSSCSSNTFLSSDKSVSNVASSFVENTSSEADRKSSKSSEIIPDSLVVDSDQRSSLSETTNRNSVSKQFQSSASNFVPISSSSNKSTNSVKTIPDSIVCDSDSNKSNEQFSSKETVPNSLVKNSSSSSNNRDSHALYSMDTISSQRSSFKVPLKFVPNSSSSKSTNSMKTIPDSFVSDSNSMKSSAQCSSKNSVPNSLVENTSSSSRKLSDSMHEDIVVLDSCGSGNTNSGEKETSVIDPFLEDLL